MGQKPATRYHNPDMGTFTNSFSSNSPSSLVLTKHSTPPTRHTQLFFPRLRPSIIINPIKSSSTDGNGVTPPPAPDGVDLVRFRRRSGRRSRRQRKEDEGAESEMQFPKPKGVIDPSSPKKWEDKNLAEKAMELYMGEKGLLFWLNKFAYASIFIVIGGWILFRFVGPSLNLYQLDSAPLSPSSMFKGS